MGVRACICILLSVLIVEPGNACTRFLWKSSDQNTVIGRNMDWGEEMGSNMWLLPRGMERQGGVTDNPLNWTSKYGSVILTAYDIGTADGINEKGLVANILYLTESDFGIRNTQLPGISVSLWAQYFLDNFETVKEALGSLEAKPFQIQTFGVETSMGRKEGAVHLAISDKEGDTAVIEYVGGKAKIYHDKSYKVMTNSPPFDQQLAALKQYQGFGGDKKLPGTTEAADRFVRAAYYAQHLPPPQDYREAIAGVFSVLRNVSQPFGAPDPARPYISTTRWRAVADMKRGIYFYENTLSPNVVWVQLNRLDFQKAAPVRKLSLVKNYDLVGDVTGVFKPEKMFQFQKVEKEKQLGKTQ
ncbi:linear amide C-N hydrolase [Bdellovibrio sp. HCB288]|uniref:linear amide C-N hydrolase n=1 Tax=Bdellovibrio sp. HCB288 TaxID=3394355 RepID=UPI0039B6B7FA